MCVFINTFISFRHFPIQIREEYLWNEILSLSYTLICNNFMIRYSVRCYIFVSTFAPLQYVNIFWIQLGFTELFSMHVLLGSKHFVCIQAYMFVNLLIPIYRFASTEIASELLHRQYGQQITVGHPSCRVKLI